MPLFGRYPWYWLFGGTWVEWHGPALLQGHGCRRIGYRGSTVTHARYLPPLLACAVLVACTGGCPGPLEIASRSYNEVKGAQDQEKTISNISSAELTRHGSVRLDQVVSRIGPLVPAEFIPAVEANLRKELANLKGLRAGGPPMKVRGEITYYQAAGSVDMLQGKAAIAVMHVTAAAADGHTIGEYLVVASSQAILRTGDMELAQALARGTARFFQDKLPK